jgi:hypothetical protein
MVGSFDRGEGWREDGATSMTAWLRHQGRMSSGQASRTARTARRLCDLLVTAGAYRDGVLSGGQLQAIVANLNDDIAPLFAGAEAGMVPLLAPLSVADVRRVMQAWVEAAKDELQDDDPDDDQLPQRTLHLSETLDGRGDLSASLDPEARALVDCALRVATTDDVEGEPARSPGASAGRCVGGDLPVLPRPPDHRVRWPAPPSPEPVPRLRGTDGEDGWWWVAR